MPNRLQKLPVLVYVPAIPGYPGRAAYCEGTTKVSSPSGISGGVGSGSSGGSGGSNSYQPFGDDYGIAVQGPPLFSQSGNRPTVHNEQVCYPAIPAVIAQPARYDQADNMGWNAGARSIDSISGDGYFQCTLPGSPIAIQVGFSVRQFEPRYSSMRHSMVARRTELTVVESGITVFGPIAIVGDEVLQIRRRQGVVTYLVDDIEIYESEQASTGERYGAAVLYSPSDFVDSPVIEALAAAPLEFSTSIPAVRAAIGEDDFTLVRAEMPAIQFTATLDVVNVLQFTAQFPAVRAAIGDVAFNAVQTSFSSLQFTAEGGMLEAIPNNVVALIVPPRLNATLAVGQAVEFTTAFPAMVAGISEEHTTYVRGVAALRLISSIVEPYMADDEIDGSDMMLLFDIAALQSAVLLFAYESLEVDNPVATLTVIVELHAAESLSIEENVSLGAIVELIAREELAIANSMATARSQALQYAVNYLTNALTTYRQFDFDGFARAGASTFAWREDGLYRIGGATDDGEVIEALIDYGTTDFYDDHTKRINAVYLGVRTDGECYIRVTADEGSTRVYRLVGGNNVKRSQLAAGVTGRYWNMILEITDASFASVDSLEIEVGTSQRRLFNRENL